MEESAETSPKILVSITKIQLKDPSTAREFSKHTRASFNQARENSLSQGGLLGQPRLKIDGSTYYTLSSWQSEQAMRDYVDQGNHKEAMEASPNIGQVESFHWYAERTPSFDEAINKLNEEVERRRQEKQQREKDL